jgi:hypothetical protein
MTLRGSKRISNVGSALEKISIFVDIMQFFARNVNIEAIVILRNFNHRAYIV